MNITNDHDMEPDNLIRSFDMEEEECLIPDEDGTLSRRDLIELMSMQKEAVAGVAYELEQKRPYLTIGGETTPPALSECALFDFGKMPEIRVDKKTPIAGPKYIEVGESYCMGVKIGFCNCPKGFCCEEHTLNRVDGQLVWPSDIKVGEYDCMGVRTCLNGSRGKYCECQELTFHHGIQMLVRRKYVEIAYNGHEAAIQYLLECMVPPPPGNFELPWKYRVAMETCVFEPGTVDVFRPCEEQFHELFGITDHLSSLLTKWKRKLESDNGPRPFKYLFDPARRGRLTFRQYWLEYLDYSRGYTEKEKATAKKLVKNLRRKDAANRLDGWY